MNYELLFFFENIGEFFVTNCLAFYQCFLSHSHRRQNQVCGHQLHHGSGDHSKLGINTMAGPGDADKAVCGGKHGGVVYFIDFFIDFRV